MYLVYEDVPTVYHIFVSKTGMRKQDEQPNGPVFFNMQEELSRICRVHPEYAPYAIPYTEGPRTAAADGEIRAALQEVSETIKHLAAKMNAAGPSSLAVFDTMGRMSKLSLLGANLVDML